jgi:hypothetical protein
MKSLAEHIAEARARGCPDPKPHVTWGGRAYYDMAELLGCPEVQGQIAWARERREASRLEPRGPHAKE